MIELGPQKKWIPGYGLRYYATWQGKVFRVFLDGRKKEIKGFRKGNAYVIKLTDGTGKYQVYLFNRLIWMTFKGPIPPGYLVVRKTPILTENGMYNLRLRTQEQHGKKTGRLSNSKPVVLLNDNGQIIDSWPSARRAARDLFVSSQTVSDVCNGKIKKPIINVRGQKEKDLDYPRLPGEFERMVK